MFNFFFEVRRPGITDEEPHQQRCRNGKQSVIEEADRNETKNQIRTPPEPDVLMKYVEGSDRNNKQDALHVEWSLTVTKRLDRVKAFYLRRDGFDDAERRFRRHDPI